MTTKDACLECTDQHLRRTLDDALRDALCSWQLCNRHTLRPWLRGYCGDFAEVVAKFFGEPASLQSVVATDGCVHHIVASVGKLVIDARGVNTRESLIAEINRVAVVHFDSLNAVEIIPFEPEHIELFKSCPARWKKNLARHLNTPKLRHAREMVRQHRCSSPLPKW